MTSLLTESTLTPEERAAVDDHPRPGVWAGQTDADLRDLTQEETDTLIRFEIWSSQGLSASRSEILELKSILGRWGSCAIRMTRPRVLSDGPGPELWVMIAHRQRGGIDSDPIARLLAYRAWGDRDRKWRRPLDPVAAALSKIRSAIAPFVYRVRSEAELQDAVCHALDRTSDLTYEREVSIGSLNRYDILVRVHAYGDDGRPAPTAKIVIELKLRASTAAVDRQVQRYALVPDVDAVMVATTSNRLAAELSLSPMLGGKPFSVVALRTS